MLTVEWEDLLLHPAVVLKVAIFLFFFLVVKTLGRLCKVNVLATCTSTARDDVVRVNLCHVVVFFFVLFDLVAFTFDLA